MAKEILMVAAPHGNERLGQDLFIYILNHHPDLIDHIDIIVGNPKAALTRTRYVDTDLNRSYYGGYKDGYEKSRAVHISNYILTTKPRLILDMHTTRVDEDPCFIAYNMGGEVAKFMAASHPDKVVEMIDSMARTSLIGAHPHAVSIEVANDHINPELLEKFSVDIRNYLRGVDLHRKKQLFHVDGMILKNQPERYEDEPLEEFRNFHKSKKFGFYPILMGENSYRTDTTKTYLGFYAHKKQSVDILDLHRGEPE